ncbi:MAG: SGNH/GDSL hydrolase family protein [Acidimicrobiales bacterium]
MDTPPGDTPPTPASGRPDGAPPFVPVLQAKPPGAPVRVLAALTPRIRAVTDQIEPYTLWWNQANEAAAGGEGPLLVAVGDSTAVGIGASAPGRGYVGLLVDLLREHRDPRWRVINLGQSGARADDAVGRQLPAAHRLGPDLVVCCIGTNDLVWTMSTAGLQRRLRALVDGLPISSIVGLPAGASPRARAARRAVVAAGAERGLAVVDPWSEPAPAGGVRLAVDRFHPSDLGYQLMAVPFARQLALPVDGLLRSRVRDR